MWRSFVAHEKWPMFWFLQCSARTHTQAGRKTASEHWFDESRHHVSFQASILGCYWQHVKVRTSAEVEQRRNWSETVVVEPQKKSVALYPSFGSLPIPYNTISGDNWWLQEVQGCCKGLFWYNSLSDWCHGCDERSVRHISPSWLVKSINMAISPSNKTTTQAP